MCSRSRPSRRNVSRQFLSSTSIATAKLGPGICHMESLNHDESVCTFMGRLNMMRVLVQISMLLMNESIVEIQYLLFIACRM